MSQLGASNTLAHWHHKWLILLQSEITPSIQFAPATRHFFFSPWRRSLFPVTATPRNEQRPENIVRVCVAFSCPRDKRSLCLGVYVICLWGISSLWCMRARTHTQTHTHAQYENRAGHWPRLCSKCSLSPSPHVTLTLMHAGEWLPSALALTQMDKGWRTRTRTQLIHKSSTCPQAYRYSLCTSMDIYCM